ncbi:hypothetical protein ACH4C2_30690 [Streptomyces sp. NPDC018057]|uniref:hypothetical protein n=1 Tax=unclassified Streptomyces TaxID=2593676 RepID=UPI0037A15A8D
MIVGDRMQAVADADGGLFTRALGALHPRLGAPVRTGLLSGTVAALLIVGSIGVVVARRADSPLLESPPGGPVST